MSTANVGHGATIAAPTTTAYTIAVTVRRSRSAARIGLTSKAPLPPGVRADGLGHVPHQAVGLSSDRLLEERHQPADLVGLARPVLGGEAVERQVLDAALARGAQGAPDRLDARAVTGDCGKVTPTRPSAVPVHDDRDVPGYGHARRGYTSRISFSLAAPTSSAMRIYRSVSFCSCTSDRFTSSAETPELFSFAFISSWL